MGSVAAFGWSNTARKLAYVKTPLLQDYSNEHFISCFSSRQLRFNICVNESVWPDFREKSSTIFFQKLPKKEPMQFLHKSEAFQNSPKSCQPFGLLLIDILSPRTFKNHPIWSHWNEFTFSLTHCRLFLQKNHHQIFGPKWTASF